MVEWNKPKCLILFLGLLFTSYFSNAQTLYFCEDVDTTGNPIRQSALFYIGQTGGYIDMLMQVPDGVKSAYVNYDIYKIIEGKEKFQTTIKQDVEGNWSYFWKQITFHAEGMYRVYAYNDANDLLAKSDVEIQFVK